MDNSKPFGRELAEFRRKIHKSQSQFAAMLGVSKHTIISVENGRNRLSPKLTRRIRIATGAPIESERDGDLLERCAATGRFDTWRQHFKSDEETALNRFGEICYWIKLVFRAAGRPGVAGNRDRLPAVYLSLLEWLEETRTTCKLQNEIDDILEEETRHFETGTWTDVYLRENEELAERVAGQLGISLAKLWQGFKAHKKKDNWVVLFAKLEARDAWNPEAGEFPPHPTDCKVRKTKPKYWFKTLDLSKKPKSK